MSASQLLAWVASSRVPPGSGLADVVHIPPPYAYRSPFENDENNMAAFCQGLETINWTTTGKPAAIFLAAVGLANIEILERQGLVQNAEVMGRYLKDEFEKMQAKDEILGDVRGLGLMIGLEIVIDKASKVPSPLHASAISEYCRTHGLLLGHRSSGAVSGNVIRILPPLILTRTEAGEAVLILKGAFVHAEKTEPSRPGEPTVRVGCKGSYGSDCSCHRPLVC